MTANGKKYGHRQTSTRGSGGILNAGRTMSFENKETKTIDENVEERRKYVWLTRRSEGKVGISM